MAVAHQTSAAIVDYLVGVSFEQSRYIGFDRMPEQPRAPLRNTSVSRSPKVPRWGNCKTLVSVMAMEASNPRYATSSLHAVTNFRI
jgi:hypothetical protein